MAVSCSTAFAMQGVIVAAPVYAATGKRWKALAAAFASVRHTHLFNCSKSKYRSLLDLGCTLTSMQGLSEPVGALLAVVAVKPFITEEPLHYILAFVGGIMVRHWP